MLTSTILSSDNGRPVPDMALEKIAVPVLVVHHKLDGCKHCAHVEIPRLMDKLSASHKTELLTFEEGLNRGDPCQAFAYHGFNGIEKDVVIKVAEWIIAK